MALRILARARPMRPWYPDLRAELLAFPAASMTTSVDALGLVGQLLDRMQVGTRLPGDIKRPRATNIRGRRNVNRSSNRLEIV